MKSNNVNVREVRTFAAAELRAVSDADGKKYLEGYAARYNVRSSELGWGMYEILLPGTFTRALAEGQDVRHLINHDPSLLLGRTASGTTALSEDAQGLRFRTLLPDTQIARDLCVSVERGDISECSFAFRVRKATWLEDKDADGNEIDLRQVEDVDLLDVSIVTYPAYPSTSAKLAMRAMFPEGLPAEIRAKMEDGGDDVDECSCPCEDCVAGRCEMCSNEDCTEEACLHGYSADKASARTKLVDGEALPAEAFLVVGDPENTDTWKLPLDFKSEEKRLNHIKNALARFDSVKDGKREAWLRLEKLAEDHNIKVSEEDKAKYRDALTPAEEAAMAAKAALDKAAETYAATLRAIDASL